MWKTPIAKRTSVHPEHKVILPKKMKKSWLRSPDPFFGEAFRGFSLAVCFGKCTECTAHGARSLYPPSNITIAKKKFTIPKGKDYFPFPLFPRIFRGNLVFRFVFSGNPKTVTKITGIHRSHPFDRRDVHAIDQVVEVCSWDVFGLLDLRGSEMVGNGHIWRRKTHYGSMGLLYLPT